MFDKMKTLLIYIGLFLTVHVLETSTASENARKEGKARFIFRLRIFTLFFPDQWCNLVAQTKGVRKSVTFEIVILFCPFNLIIE